MIQRLQKDLKGKDQVHLPPSIQCFVSIKKGKMANEKKFPSVHRENESNLNHLIVHELVSLALRFSIQGSLNS